MRILITNDDSHSSPLLEIAVEYFSKLGEVHLIVPLHEQSWTGKSMTRFNPVHVHRAELYGHAASYVGGTPADCVNLGIYNLMDTKPDLVVSGINAGFNIGVGFILSSGTVGACLEANLAHIPAIALSQAFDTATRNRYMADYMIESAQRQIFREQSFKVLDRVTGALFSNAAKADTLSCPITWNVNLPFNLCDPEVLKVAPIGATRYGRCFIEEPLLEGSQIRTFRHAKIDEVRDPDPGCDSSQIHNGCATISPLDLWGITGSGQDKKIEHILASFAPRASTTA